MIRILGPLLDFSAAVIPAVHEKNTMLQESKLENSICRCLETMYHQMEQINLQKQTSQKALQKHQVKLFFSSSAVEAAMHGVPCLCAKGHS